MGRHKHIFADFDNLAAADDNDFNDMTSSILVISGWWTVYEDAFFSGNSWGTDTPDGASPGPLRGQVVV